MATQAKTVCIIGAGPSGLVAAKTLAHDHPKDTFHVTVFEQSDRIGGLWPVAEKDDDGMVNPDMCTNQSRHTVSFSDLSWYNHDPSFPKAWQVGQYLERYALTYPGYTIRTRCKVVKVVPPSGLDNVDPAQWEVIINDYNDRPAGDRHSMVQGLQNIYHFDHLIIATGFFGKPSIPKYLMGFPAPVFHSSQLRDVKHVLTDNGKLSETRGTRIVVVGGQMSGVETAASIALQLSSAVNSPGESPISDASKYSVHHIVQRPFWVMPLYFPKDPMLDTDEEGVKVPNPASSFLPLDLVVYNLKGRPPGPIKNNSGHITPEAAGMTNDFVNAYLGSDQSELGTENIAMKGDIRSEPPWVTCSDHYNEFVRSGIIQTHTGKVTGLSFDNTNTIIISDEGNRQELNDIAAVIFATGFEASPSLEFLDQKALETLQFDAKCGKFPLALNVHSTAQKSIPSLGFVGFYRSPYWGVMEMQARFLGKLWSGDAQAAKTLAEDDTLDKMLALRTSSDDRVAQFPMGDYAYLMESFSVAVGIQRTEFNGGEGKMGGIVLPQLYVPDTASETQREQASTALSIIENIMTDSATKGKFVARAVFRALQGDWKLERSLISELDAYPSGKFSGTAKFLPRFPTDSSSSSSSSEYDMEYLYVEEGDFKTEQGLTFRANRRYAYRYQEATDTLSAWFITPSNNKTVDYLFHEIEILPPPPSPPPTATVDNSNKSKTESKTKSSGWRGRAHHLCIDDTYDVSYEFPFKGTSLDDWTLAYSVKGPNKDYRIRSVYRR